MKTRISILMIVTLMVSMTFTKPVIAQQKSTQNSEQLKKEKKEEEKRQKQEEKRNKKAAKGLRNDNPYY
jgi:hypothetical protein